MSVAFEHCHMPAEWQAHEATWLAWPHHACDWPGKLESIQWVYGEIVRKLAPGERIHILVNDLKQETKAKGILGKIGVAAEQVFFFRFSTDRAWVRDFGPIFVEAEKSGPRKTPRKKQQLIARFRFNGWAKYANWSKDDRIPDRIAEALKTPAMPVRHRDREVVLEGGAIDVNGRGTLLVTEECMLHKHLQIRNPGFERRDYEQIFRDHLGVQQVLWLGCGIAGDDTHGHVDDLCRFVNENTVILCQEKNGRDANHAPLAENYERLKGIRLANGKALEVITLPMPGPLVFEGERLPASYANFYIGNAAVLVPTFNDPNDAPALGILSELFTDRPVIGIHAVDLVLGLGTLHCLTQQQPRAPK